MDDELKNKRQRKPGEIPEGVLISLLADTKKAKSELEKAKKELEKKNVDLEKALKVAEEATQAKASAAAAAAADTERIKSKEIRAIVTSMPTAMIVIDPDATIKTVNQTALDYLGYKEKEMIGKSVEMLFEERAAAAAAAAAENILKAVGLGGVIADGLVKNVERNFLTKKGEKIPMSISGSTIRDEEGNVISIVLISQDLREIRRLERERTEALEKANIDLETMVKQRTEELEEAKTGLEVQIAERTKELQDKLLELERFNKVAVGRELKMVELKEEIARLKGEKTQKPKEVESPAAKKSKDL